MEAGDDDVDATEKSTFRCLDAARWVVAAAVMVVIVAVIAYAFIVVSRTSEIYLSVVRGSVAVHSNTSSTRHNITFTYSVHAVNPSGRVRIYYTDIRSKLNAINSSGEDNSFLVLRLPDVALAPQSAVDTILKLSTSVRYPFQQDYFDKLGNGTNIDKATIVLNGTLTIEIYSGHNKTPIANTLYYCWPIVVLGVNEDDDDSGGSGTAGSGMNAPCTDKPPTSMPPAS